jgi:hypothetical protein
MSPDQLRPSTLTALLVAWSLFVNPMAKPRIVPIKTSAGFSSQTPENPWSIPIRSTDGSTAYLLSLEPDLDVGHHVVTLELVLRHPGDKTYASNLLDPTGRRHGLQSYDFAANDLARGVQNSAFGKKRTVFLKNLGLVVRIDVLKATVSPVAAGTYQVDSLNLQIEVDNANP